MVILISLIWTAPNGPYPFCSFASSVCVTLITPSSGLNKLLPVNQRHLVFMLPPLPLAGDVTIHLLMLVDLLSCWPWPIFGLPCRRVPTRSRNAERLGTSSSTPGARRGAKALALRYIQQGGWHWVALDGHRLTHDLPERRDRKNIEALKRAQHSRKRSSMAMNWAVGLSPRPRRCHKVLEEKSFY